MKRHHRTRAELESMARERDLLLKYLADKESGYEPDYDTTVTEDDWSYTATLWGAAQAHGGYVVLVGRRRDCPRATVAVWWLEDLLAHQTAHAGRWADALVRIGQYLHHAQRRIIYGHDMVYGDG